MQRCHTPTITPFNVRLVAAMTLLVSWHLILLASGQTAPENDRPAQAPTIDKQVEVSSSDHQTRDRLVAAGLVSGVVLAMLGLAFGYLRLDHATRGFYSGRLQLIASVLGLGILLVGYLLWTRLL